jgi:hypothetical protein
MRKVQLLFLIATVGVCAAVATTPASAATNVSTQVATLTAGQPMPILFAGTKDLYGHRVNQGDPIPAGSAVVKVTVEPLVNQKGDAFFTAPGPQDTGAIDFGQPAGVPGLGGGFDAPLGMRVMQFRFVPPFTGAAGFSDVFMLCLPGVSNLITQAKSRVAPVTFPGNGFVKGIKRGAHLRPGQVVMKNQLVGISRGQAMWAGTQCPKRYLPVLGASGTTGVKAMLGGDIFTLQPTKDRTFRATVYTVCQAAGLR